MTTAAGLPHDSEAERAVVGGILLLGSKALEDALRTGMDFPDFYDERLRLVIRACLEVAKRDSPVDSITVKSTLAESGELEKVGIAYLSDLTSGIPFAMNISAYAQLIRQKAIERRAIAAAQIFQTAMLSGDGQLESAQHDLENALGELSKGKASADFPPPSWKSYDVALIDEWDCPDIEWVVENIIARGNLVWLAAESQVGKTLLATYLMMRILRPGRLFGEFQITPVHKILYLLLEDPPRRAKKRILDMAFTDPLNLKPGELIFYSSRGLALGDERATAHIRDLVAREHFDVVVLDTFQAATPGMTSFDDEKLSLIILKLAQIARDFGTVMWVHDHFRKADSRFRGGKQFEAAAIKGTVGKVVNSDVIILLDRNEKDQIMVSVRSKETGKKLNFLLDVADEGDLSREKFIYAGDMEAMASAAKGRAARTKKAILDAMKGISWSSAGEIVELADSGCKTTILKYLNKFIEEGKVEKTGEGKDTRYRLPADAEENGTNDAVDSLI